MLARRTIALRRRSVLAVSGAVLFALAGYASPVSATPGDTATATAGAAIDARIASRLGDAVSRAMTEASIPGAIIGIWSPAGDYVRTFGIADKSTGAPMQADFHSRIGSVTKTFTVTAMLQLVDQGKLRLDDPIAKYIPGVPSGERITLRELAKMASGLVTFDDVPAFVDAYTADPYQAFTPQQTVGYALDQPLQFEPGTQYQYSNTNTVLLGLVVEQQSGRSLPDYIGEHILSPLALAHTSFPTTAAFPDPHPQGYTTLDGRDQVATDWNPSWAWGAGNMVSTLEDMRIWAVALATGTLLTPEIQRERFEATMPMNREGTAVYGLGLFKSGGWIGHSGAVFGYQTVAFHLPQKQTTLVFFINTDAPHQASTILAQAITRVITPDHVY